MQIVLCLIARGSDIMQMKWFATVQADALAEKHKLPDWSRANSLQVSIELTKSKRDNIGAVRNVLVIFWQKWWEKSQRGSSWLNREWIEKPGPSCVMDSVGGGLVVRLSGHGACLSVPWCGFWSFAVVEMCESGGPKPPSHYLFDVLFTNFCLLAGLFFLKFHESFNLPLCFSPIDSQWFAVDIALANVLLVFGVVARPPHCRCCSIWTLSVKWNMRNEMCICDSEKGIQCESRADGACASTTYRSHKASIPSSHFVDRAGWQAKMACFEFWIPFAQGPMCVLCHMEGFKNNGVKTIISGTKLKLAEFSVWHGWE